MELSTFPIVRVALVAVVGIRPAAAVAPAGPQLSSFGWCFGDFGGRGTFEKQ